MKAFTSNFVQAKLNSIGIHSGDMVFVHTDLNQFGFLKNKDDQFQLALTPNVLLKALQKTVGVKGTIVVPAFTSISLSCNIFSAYDSVSHMGVFIEHLRQQKNCLRSIHPLFSLAAIGSKAKMLTEDVDTSGYGENSPFRHLKEHNAKLLMVGVPYCSFKDYIELQCKIPYRYKKFFHSTIKTKSETYKATFEHNVKYISPEIITIPFYDALNEKEKIKLHEVQLGSGMIRCIEAECIYEVLKNKIDANPLFLLKETPNHLEALLTIHKITQPLENEEGTTLRLFAFQEEHCEKWAWVLSNSREWEAQIRDKLGIGVHNTQLPTWVQNQLKPSECAIIVGNAEKIGSDTSIEIISPILDIKPLNALKYEFVLKLLNHDNISIIYNNRSQK